MVHVSNLRPCATGPLLVHRETFHSSGSFGGRLLGSARGHVGRAVADCVISDFVVHKHGTPEPLAMSGPLLASASDGFRRQGSTWRCEHGVRPTGSSRSPASLHGSGLRAQSNLKSATLEASQASLA